MKFPPVVNSVVYDWVNFNKFNFRAYCRIHDKFFAKLITNALPIANLASVVFFLLIGYKPVDSKPETATVRVKLFLSNSPNNEGKTLLSIVSFDLT